MTEKKVSRPRRRPQTPKRKTSVQKAANTPTVPDEIVAAKEQALAAKALVRERPPAVAAPDAGLVPRPLQHRVHVLVQDGPLAARATARAEEARGRVALARRQVQLTAVVEVRGRRARGLFGPFVVASGARVATLFGRGCRRHNDRAEVVVR